MRFRKALRDQNYVVTGALLRPKIIVKQLCLQNGSRCVRVNGHISRLQRREIGVVSQGLNILIFVASASCLVRRGAEVFLRL